MGVERGDRAASARQAAENFRFFGAPHVAVVSTPSNQGTYGSVDGAMYVANFVLAAQSLGVATVIQASIANHAPFIRRYLGVPAGQSVLVGVAFGYADDSHPANSFRTSRVSIDEIAHFHDD